MWRGNGAAVTLKFPFFPNLILALHSHSTTKGEQREESNSEACDWLIGCLAPAAAREDAHLAAACWHIDSKQAEFDRH